MIDTSSPIPQTPGGLLQLLEQMLDARIPRMLRYDRYAKGHHDLRFATSKFEEAFGDLFGPLADNWCKLIIAAVTERLDILGFRFGAENAADHDARSIWRRNKLKSRSKRLHRATIRRGYGYAMVGPGAPGKEPRITVESALEVIVLRDPGDTDQLLAGLKRWHDKDGYAYAVVYEPTRITVFRSKERVLGLGAAWGAANWTSQGTTPNTLGVVPIVEFVNDPDDTGHGHSELEDAIPLQDAINKLVLDMLVASEFAAFRQRVLSGIEIPKDPDTGKPLVDPKEYVQGLVSAVSRTWAFPSSEVKAQEFSATDLSNFVQAIEMIVQHLAAITRTPPHYLLGQSGAFPSGESLQSTETGLVAKAEDKQVEWSDSWEDVMRLAFRARALELERALRDRIAMAEEFNLGGGDAIDALRTRLAQLGETIVALEARGMAAVPTPVDLAVMFAELASIDRAATYAEDYDATTLWRDPEKRSWGQLIDGLSKLGGDTIGVPKRWLWEQIPDVRPEDVERMETLKAEEQAAAERLLFGPSSQGVVPEPAPAPAPAT